MKSADLLQRVKDNLIITFNDDDSLILGFIDTAISYAEGYQHLDAGYYEKYECSETTKLAIVQLASHFYESRDGSTGGFFADSSNAADSAWASAQRLLSMDKEWKL